MKPPGRMKTRIEHFQRWRQIAGLMWKHGRAVRAGDGADEAAQHRAEQLADDLESMGPAYVKLGQVLSSRPDLLPAGYVKACSRRSRISSTHTSTWAGATACG